MSDRFGDGGRVTDQRRCVAVLCQVLSWERVLFSTLNAEFLVLKFPFKLVYYLGVLVSVYCTRAVYFRN